jgi:membrane dipeptidase
MKRMKTMMLPILGCCLAALAFGRFQAPAAQDEILWRKSLELKDRLLIVDAHSHDLFKPEETRWPKQVNVSFMKKGGMDGLVQGLPLGAAKVEDPVGMILDSIRKLKADIEAEAKSYGLALKADDFETIKGTGRRAVMIGLEYFYGLLGGRLDTLDKYKAEGVAIIGLFHGGPDRLLEGEGDDQRLSPFALAVISEMNRLGIACDISHMSRPTAKIRREVIEASRAPVIISHANAAGLVPDPFNVEDDTLDLLAAKGGLICLTFFSEYVSPECFALKDKVREPENKPRAKVEEFVDHIDYVKNRVGIEHIAIGSDYGGSGRMAPRELMTAEGFPLIIHHMLKRGYTEREIAAVMGGNFVRYLKRVEDTARAMR